MVVVSHGILFPCATTSRVQCIVPGCKGRLLHLTMPCVLWYIFRWYYNCMYRWSVRFCCAGLEMFTILSHNVLYIYINVYMYITYLYILITCKDAVLKICVFSSLWLSSAYKSYRIFGSKGNLLKLRWVVHILLWVVFEIFLLHFNIPSFPFW